MNDLDASAFASLFNDAVTRCFNHPLTTPLTEPESKLLSNDILQRTGLVIGWKSIKNYSSYLLHQAPDKEEHPSIATLDTLARYVRSAPRTDEEQRQKHESHYPHWFAYRTSVAPSARSSRRMWKITGAVVIAAGALSVALLMLLRSSQPAGRERFTDDFRSVEDDSLKSRGWIVLSKDAEYWKRRGESPGQLTLFTLRGDNWPDSGETPQIRNLLVREVPGDCFDVEVHFADFIPARNWQQAGIILMEDTSFSGKSVRLSLAYNDFMGGFPKSKEILVQAMTSPGKGFQNPEEIAHGTLFRMQTGSELLIAENLKYSAFRIEKEGSRFRFLFSNGSMGNSAFKEIAERELALRPKYVGAFALRGLVNDSVAVPAHVTQFVLTSRTCNKADH